MVDLERLQLLDRVAVLSGRLDYALAPASELTPEAVQRWNRQSATDRLVCVDEELVYARFFADFGPLNLGQIVRFCQIMSQTLDDADNDNTVVLVSSDHPHKRANAMNLLALYLVICRDHSPEQAIAPFSSLRTPFGFRDAACGICTYFTTILDCARAVHKVGQLDRMPALAGHTYSLCVNLHQYRRYRRGSGAWRRSRFETMSTSMSSTTETLTGSCRGRSSRSAGRSERAWHSESTRKDALG